MTPAYVHVRLHAKPLENARCVSLKSRVVCSKSDAENSCMKLRQELEERGWKSFDIVAVGRQEHGETQQLKGIKSK